MRKYSCKERTGKSSKRSNDRQAGIAPKCQLRRARVVEGQSVVLVVSRERERGGREAKERTVVVWWVWWALIRRERQAQRGSVRLLLSGC